jgi:hypothetical protein
MVLTQKKSLQPLLDSKEGLHLTSYISAQGSILEWRRKIEECLEMAREYLRPALDEESTKKFLDPIVALKKNLTILRGFKGNMGIFRSADGFRVIRVPVAVEDSVVVSSSFHVKPLLRWLQSDQDFILIGISDDSASLYSGNLAEMRKSDSILFPEGLLADTGDGSYASLKDQRNRRIKMNESLIWLNDWIDDLLAGRSCRVFVTGHPVMTKAFLAQSRLKNLHRTSLGKSTKIDAIEAARLEIMKLIKNEGRRRLEQSLVEFYFAEEVKLAKRNIFQIAKAVCSGRVKKLIVADGIQIFGTLDRKTGGVAIHPAQLSHEDDDLLDDLAQEVLHRGGEVVVAPLDEIPNRRPILAILESTNEKRQPLFEQIASAAFA